jgi:hypothetical protein
MTAFSLLSRHKALVLAGVVALAAPLAVSSAQDAIVQGTGKWQGNFGGRSGAQIRIEPTKKADESQARFEVANGGSNILMAWDIAEGVCGDNAQSIVPRAKFRQIQTGTDGSGSARATIPRLSTSKRYYARMFSPDAANNQDSGVTCVNLSETP